MTKAEKTIEIFRHLSTHWPHILMSDTNDFIETMKTMGWQHEKLSRTLIICFVVVIFKNEFLSLLQVFFFHFETKKVHFRWYCCFECLLFGNLRFSTSYVDMRVITKIQSLTTLYCIIEWIAFRSLFRINM